MRANTFLGFLAVCVTAVTVVAQDDPSAPIRQLRTALQTAYYHGDAKAVSELFTDDAEIVIDRVSVVGQPQIQAFYKARLASGPLLILHPTRTQASGSLAVESGRCASQLPTVRFGATAWANEGRYVMTLVNIEGEWLISSLMIQSNVTLRPENTVDRPAVERPSAAGV